MRKCQTCKIEKDESLFCRESRQKDGLCKQCKECLSKRKEKYRNENPERYRECIKKSAKKNAEKIKEKNRKKYQETREEYLEKRRIYYQENRERLRKEQNERCRTDKYREKSRLRQKKFRKERKELYKSIINNWISKNRIKKRCHYAISDAIRKGKMVRGEICECCQIHGKMEAHHEDYDKPLEVVWLCKSCHVKRHRKIDDSK